MTGFLICKFSFGFLKNKQEKRISFFIFMCWSSGGRAGPVAFEGIRRWNRRCCPRCVSNGRRSPLSIASSMFPDGRLSVGDALTWNGFRRTLADPPAVFSSNRLATGK
jgi:hypothetical protein